MTHIPADLAQLLLLYLQLPHLLVQLRNALQLT